LQPFRDGIRPFKTCHRKECPPCVALCCG